jgi:Flp pilus assembly protein TadG
MAKVANLQINARVKELRANERAGAALIEFTVVASIFILLLFGVMEYCRFIWVRNMVTYGAREGCRYCVVRTDATTPEADTQAYVASRLGNLTGYKNYKCDVYWSDSTGKYLGPVSSATFGQLIAVEVSLDYSPILPSLFFMQNTYTLKSRCMMNSEAN